MSRNSEHRPSEPQFETRRASHEPTDGRRETRVEEQPSRHEYLQRFAERLPGGRRGVAALLALGVGVFPLGRELLYRTQNESIGTSVRGSGTDKEKAATLLAQFGQHEVKVETDGGNVRVIFDGTDGASSHTLDVQPDPVHGRIDTGFLWGLRDYSRVQEMPNEQEALRDQVRAFLQDYFDQHGALGQDAREAIASVKVDISAFASPEGTELRNQALTELRAKQSEAVIREVLSEFGIDGERADVTVRGLGEEAGFEGFIQALAEAGVELSPKTGAAQERVAEQIIRDIHDGKISDQRILDAYQEHIASQRHVVTDIRIESAPVQVVVTEGFPGSKAGEKATSWTRTDANAQWVIENLRRICVAYGIDPDSVDAIFPEELIGIVKEYGRVQEPLQDLVRALQQQGDEGGSEKIGGTGRTGGTLEPPPPPPLPPPPPPSLRNKIISASFKAFERSPVTGGQTGVGVGSIGGFKGRPSIGRAEHRSGKKPRGAATRPQRPHTGKR